jgi:hypothetical protein
MTEDDLNGKFDATRGGFPIKGWISACYQDIDVLTRLKLHTIWARRKPGGRWVELPAMGDDAHA